MLSRLEPVRYVAAALGIPRIDWRENLVEPISKEPESSELTFRRSTPFPPTPPHSTPVEDPYFGTLEREENGTPASILIWIFTGNELKQISLSWRRRERGTRREKEGLKRNRRLSLKDFYGKRLLNDRSVHSDWIIVKLNRTNRGICLCWANDRRVIGSNFVQLRSVLTFKFPFSLFVLCEI